MSATCEAATAQQSLATYALRLADDALILGHRLSEWCGKGPTLEEDMALANIGLDLIGQARALYAHAGEVEGRGRGEDQLAYLRDERQYLNLLLAEQPNGDFAFTILRQLAYAAFMVPFWERLEASRDTALAAIAAKSVKEARYHLRHAAEWTIRLGDGTAESRRRMEAALDELWPFTGELFEQDGIEAALATAGIAVDRPALREGWRAMMERVLAEATLACPRDGGWMQGGGRRGLHSEHMGYLLAELQHLPRSHPGAVW